MDYFQATADSSVGPFCITFTIKNTKHVKKKKKKEMFFCSFTLPLSLLFSLPPSHHIFMTLVLHRSGYCELGQLVPCNSFSENYKVLIGQK